MSAKTHLIKGVHNNMQWAWCGRSVGTMSSQTEDVTCRSCVVAQYEDEKRKAHIEKT